jgi:hypothetical protein
MEGRLALNRAGHAGIGYEINPIVGVRHEQLERLTDELLALRPSKERTSSVIATLDHIMRRPYTAFFFAYDAPVLPTAKTLVETFREHGLPYIEARRDLRALVADFLPIRYGMDLCRLPTAYVLLGEFSAAERAIEEQLARFADGADTFAPAYTAFVARLRAYVRNLGT